MLPELAEPHNPSTANRGFTLLELIVAILVLSIGTLAIMRTLDQSRREIGEAPVRYFAQTVAANRAAELRIFGLGAADGLPDIVNQGPYAWSILTESRKTEAGLYEVTLTVRADDLPGAQLVTYAAWAPAR